MAYLCNPMPDMQDQRLFGGRIRGLINPQCGRFCLKSLLKYWHEKRTREVVTRVKFAKAESRSARLYGYHPWFDYQHAADILIIEQKSTETMPASSAAWERKLQAADGPIIVNGDGVGAAASFIGHFILVVGADSGTDVVKFLDPLRGNVVGSESAATFCPKAAELIYARGDICSKIHDPKYFTIGPQPVGTYVDLP